MATASRRRSPSSAPPQSIRAATIKLLDAARRRHASCAIIGADPAATSMSVAEWPISNGGLIARMSDSRTSAITTADRSLLLLPVLMWIAAALITWLLVSRLLIRPLQAARSER